MKDKQSGRPRRLEHDCLKLPVVGWIEEKTFVAFWATVREMERASDYERIRNIETQFNKEHRQPGKTDRQSYQLFQQIAEGLAGGDRDNEDWEKAYRRTEAELKARGITNKHELRAHAHIGMIRPVGPTLRNPLLFGDAEIGAGDCLKNLYRIPVSLHLDCPRDERIKGIDRIVAEWRERREGAGFEGKKFRAKNSEYKEGKRNRDHIRIEQCLKSCKAAARAMREKYGPSHNLEPLPPPPAAPYLEEGESAIEEFAKELLEAVDEQIRPKVGAAIRKVIQDKAQDRKKWVTQNE